MVCEFTVHCVVYSKLLLLTSLQVYSTLDSLQHMHCCYLLSTCSSSEILRGNQRKFLLAALHIALFSPAQEVAVAEVLHTCNSLVASRKISLINQTTEKQQKH